MRKTAIRIYAMMIVTMAMMWVCGSAGAVVITGPQTGYADDTTGFEHRWYARARNIESGANTFETAVGVNPNVSSGYDSGDIDWGASDTPHAFRLEYDSVTGIASFLMDEAVGSQVSYDVPDSFTDLFIQLKARPTESEAYMQVTALTLDCGSDGVDLINIGDIEAGHGTADVASWLHVYDLPVKLSETGFTLTGNVAVSWTGSVPRMEYTALDFKCVEVPEPATVALLMLGGLIMRKRRA